MDTRIVKLGLCCMALSVPLLTVVACSDESQPMGSPSAPSTTAAITASTDSDMVSLTVPAVFFEGVWESEPQAVLEDYHCTDITQNDDGSYTVSLTKQNYDALIERAYHDAQTAMGDLVQNAEHPHVTAVDYDEQFGTITVTLDTDDLAVIKAGLPYIPGGIACGYQLMAGLPVGCDVILVGPDGSDLLDTQFPTTSVVQQE